MRENINSSDIAKHNDPFIPLIYPTNISKVES
jgi:hypothetical protein